ncbi:MAG: hypothetical protein KQH63_20240 [Desulfobulbaceae bacterium]|nr:hypothetical protein [Desulfobulbaceae bacterium]
MEFQFQSRVVKRFSHLLIIACSLLQFLAGCATLPDTLEIAESDKERVSNKFKKMVADQTRCTCCIDAQATVSFSSIWKKGTLSGYLQAMSPSYLKFMGINPLGQPLAVFVTDGDAFRYVAVPEAADYAGDVHSAAYSKYAPEGFLPEKGFYWLIGRLYPGKIKILDVSRDGDAGGYWLEISYGNKTKSMVLFDEKQEVLLHHIVIDENNKKILNVLYDAYTNGPCPLPGKITVTSLVHNSTMEIRLTDWLSDASFSQKDFTYHSPPDFKRVIVK